MTDELFEYIVSIMNRRKTWIKASIENRLVSCPLDDNDEAHIWCTKSLQLTVIRRGYGYRRNKKWCFTSYELSKAVTTLSANDDHLMQRIAHQKMTSADIENIILEVSTGVIHLNLFDEELD